MTEIAVFGGGCFWCTEAVYEDLKGVIAVMPGYAGGPDAPAGRPPTYEAVCGGTTGHAEVVRIEFDPAVISYDDLLTVFFAVHDPTTLNRQGNDVGTQYRSIILYTNEEQKGRAEAFLAKLNEGGGAPAVTEVKPLSVFYPAEEYHRQYYKNNPTQGYCQFVINPKLEKVRTRFNELLKKSAQ